VSSEVIDPPVAATEVGVRRLPVPPEVIIVAVGWYLRFNLSYRDVEELLMRPTSGSTESGGTCTGRSTSTVRSSTCWSRQVGTPRGARRFFRRALSTLKVKPAEVVTDAAAVYPAVLDELIPSAWHHVEQYANNPIAADHSQLKHPLRPMRGLRTDQTAHVIIARHAFM
jgi:transposase-like protein